MTNQLFRDYLDGKIHVRRPSGPIYHFPDWSTEPVDLSRPNFWVGEPGTAPPDMIEGATLAELGYQTIGAVETDGYQFDSGREIRGTTPSGYIMDETHDWIDEAHDWRQGGIDRMNTAREVSMTIPLVWPRAFGKALERVIKHESQVNEMHAVHGRNFDPSAEYDMPDSERHEFNWRVSQLWRFTGQSPEEIADILHRFGDGAHFHMAPAPDYDRDIRVAMAPRHGPPQSASWRGRGRVTKYARG